jgi:uncharacterized protein YceK
MKIVALIALLVCSGCGSLLVQHNSKAGPYPGTRLDAHSIAHPSFDGISLGGHSDPKSSGGSFSPVALVGGIIDLPFSAALDTLLLPVDLWYPAHDYE